MLSGASHSTKLRLYNWPTLQFKGKQRRMPPCKPKQYFDYHYWHASALTPLSAVRLGVIALASASSKLDRPRICDFGEGKQFWKNSLTHAQIQLPNKIRFCNLVYAVFEGKRKIENKQLEICFETQNTKIICDLGW